MTENAPTFEGFCILEMMGHRRLAGHVREVTLAGAGFLRLDIPGDDPGTVYATQFVPPSSLYCLTPCDEETARAVARMSRPAPVQRWELPPAPREREPIEKVHDDEDEDDYDPRDPDWHPERS